MAISLGAKRYIIGYIIQRFVSIRILYGKNV